MNTEWNDVVINKACGAVYVPPNSSKHVHKARPYHGLVINDYSLVRDYYFSDGKIMHTKEASIFYLPKGSSYFVKTLSLGGCYAINFDADISDEPFAAVSQGIDNVLKSFGVAAEEWKSKSPLRNAATLKAIYDAVYFILSAEQRRYMPSAQSAILEPALRLLENDFTSNNLKISELAAACGISEVYFRRLFTAKFGTAPKEYVVRKRIEYAKSLLSSNQFTVSEVAFLCGYAEPCHFSREFAKHTGKSPTKYQSEGSDV